MVRVRFAPSPTGYLHVGNARTALFNWLFARANSGRFILRVEDTDVVRSKEIYFKKILEDMKWLGLNWDEGPDIGGPFSPYRQSERLKVYQEFAERLIRENKAYFCFCSDRELKRRRNEVLKKGLPPRYDNRCRNLAPSEIDNFKRRGIKPALRFKTPEKKLVVNDVIKGEVHFDTSLIGDFVIMKSQGIPSFNFAVVCDDYTMEISHVLRGEDHLSNTPKHILLFEALGAEPPAYGHMALTMGKGGERLSKRTCAVSITRYRELGYLPEALVNYLVLLGWAPEGGKELISVEQMIKEFKVEKLSKSGESFDQTKLDWMNGVYIRGADLDGLTKLAIPYLVAKRLVKKNLVDKRFGEIKKIVSVVRDHLSRLSQITDYTDVFFRKEIEFKDKESKLILRTIEAKTILKSFLKNIKKLNEITEENFISLFKDIETETFLKGKNLYQPLRAAITGELHGPELRLIIPILGKEKCTARVMRALKISG